MPVKPTMRNCLEFEIYPVYQIINFAVISKAFGQFYIIDFKGGSNFLFH